jgi:hypothetical protein
MKKQYAIIFCFTLLILLPTCRKKSRSEKQYKKPTTENVVTNQQ